MYKSVVSNCNCGQITLPSSAADRLERRETVLHAFAARALLVVTRLSVCLSWVFQSRPPLSAFPSVPSLLSLMSCSVSSGSGAACCLPLEWLHVLPPCRKTWKTCLCLQRTRAKVRVRDSDRARLVARFVARVWAIAARTLLGTWRVENTAKAGSDK